MNEGCSGFDEDLSAWIDGELDAEREAEVREHASGCVRCAARVDALRAVDARLRAAAARPIDPARLARLRERIAGAQSGAREPIARRAPPRRTRWILPAAAAAAAAAFAALVVPSLLERSRPPLELAGRAAAPEPALEIARPPEPAALEEFAALAREGAPLGASAPREAGAEQAPAPGSRAAEAVSDAARGDAALAELESASDEELALAVVLAGAEGVESTDDLALVERLDLVEALAELDRGGRG